VKTHPIGENSPNRRKFAQSGHPVRQQIASDSRAVEAVAQNVPSDESTKNNSFNRANLRRKIFGTKKLQVQARVAGFVLVQHTEHTKTGKNTKYIIAKYTIPI
jgi:dephospho-CoA kinase